MYGRAVLSFALVLLLSGAPPPAASASTTDPHGSEDACLSCHVAVPEFEEAYYGQYRLLGETIDATCMRCHPAQACALGLGKVVHPSGISAWDDRICDGPRTLRLFDGKITCATCHYRVKPDGDDFHLVRMAQFHLGNPDLTAFCADCHGGRL